MCLAIPGKVISIENKTAQADFGGVTRNVSVAMLPGVKPGDYILVHAGFAIQFLSEKEAEETMQHFRDIYEISLEQQEKAPEAN